MGTWALPQTTKQAEALVALLEQPLSAKEASGKLYYLLGDDDLYDDINLVGEIAGSYADIRLIVKIHLLRAIKHGGYNYARDWDSEAIRMLFGICKSQAGEMGSN